MLPLLSEESDEELLLSSSILLAMLLGGFVDCFFTDAGFWSDSISPVSRRLTAI